MSAARPERKCPALRQGAVVLAGTALTAMVLVGLAPANRPLAATTELVVTDRNTGLAIGGFDPVAYYASAAPVPGLSQHEYRFANAVWRFRNTGNRAAFATDPAQYAPRFGGYDPTGVARGVAVAGNPLLWLIVGERLYLFYSGGARDSFAAEPAQIAATADKNWKSVQLTLSP